MLFVTFLPGKREGICFAEPQQYWSDDRIFIPDFLNLYPVFLLPTVRVGKPCPFFKIILNEGILCIPDVKPGLRMEIGRLHFLLFP